MTYGTCGTKIEVKGLVIKTAKVAMVQMYITD